LKRKEYDRWVSRLEKFEALQTGNLTTVKELEELIRIFHPGLLDEWNALNQWEKLRLIELVVNESAKITAH